MASHFVAFASLAMLLVLSLLVPGSLQYGTIFADTVTPATATRTSILAVTSNTQQTTSFSLGTLKISGREGLQNQALTGAVQLVGSTVSLASFDGVRFGGAPTTSVSISNSVVVGSNSASISSAGAVSVVMTESTNLGNFNVMTLNSQISSVSGQNIVLDGKWGGKVTGTTFQADSDQAFTVTAPTASILAGNTLRIDSPSNNVQIQAGVVTLSTGYMNLNAEYTVQFASINNTVTVGSTGPAFFHGGTSALSSLNDLTITSSGRDVHFSAATLLSFTSAATATLTGGTLSLKASGNANSVVDVTSTTVTVAAQSTISTIASSVLSQGSTITVNAPSTVTAVNQAYFGSTVASSIIAQSSKSVTLAGLELDVTALISTAIASAAVDFTSSGGPVSLSTPTFSITGSGNNKFLASNLVQFFSRTGPMTLDGTTTSGTAPQLIFGGQTVSLPTATTLSFSTESFSAVTDFGFPLTLTTTSSIDLTSTSFIAVTPTSQMTITTAQFATNTVGDGSLTAPRGTVIIDYPTQTYTAISSLISSGINTTVSAGAITASGTSLLVSGGYLASLQSTGSSIQLAPTVSAAFTSARDILASSAATSTLQTVAGDIVVAADSSAAFAGNLLNIGATGGNVLIQGGTQTLITDSSSGAGISLSAPAGTVDLLSTNSSITFSSTQRLLMNANGITANQAHDIVLRGQPEQLVTSSSTYQFLASNVFNTTGNSISLTAGSTALYNATQNVVVSSGGITSLTSNGAFTATSAVFGLVGNGGALVKSDSSTVTSTVSGNLAIGSTYAGATTFVTAKTNLGFTSSASITVANPTTLTLSTDFGAGITVSATTQATFTAATANFTAPSFQFTGPQLLSFTSTTGVSLDGGSVFPATLTTTKNLFLRATSEATLLSDGDMTLTCTGPIESATEIDAKDILLRGINQVSLTGQRIDLFSNNTVNGTVAVTSGGSMSITAAGDRFDINSAQDITTTVGGALEMSATVGNFVIESPGAVGDIRFESVGGTFDAEALTGIAVNATGSLSQPIANIEMLVGGGVKFNSDLGGVALRSEGIVSKANRSAQSFASSVNASIVLETYDNNGNIAISSDIKNTYIQGKLGVISNTDSGTTSFTGAYGIDVTSGGTLTFTAGGEFFVDGEAGLTIQAGSTTSPNDLTINAIRLVDVQAPDTLSIRSEGIINAGVVIKSASGDIRFATSNGNDIAGLAEKAMSWTVGGSLVALATEDMNLISYDGPTTYTAAGDVLFTTSGGPIVFDTHSGNGGAVTLTAVKNDVNITSGGRDIFNARRSWLYEASNGVQLGSVYGSSLFTADAPDSTVAIRAGGSIQVASNDYYADVSFESANNFEAVATTTASLNAWKQITIGSITRPLVRFFTGGSNILAGYSVNSDGDLLVASNRVIDVNAVVDFTTVASRSISQLSHGPTYIKSSASDIDLRSAKGYIQIFGNTLELRGDAGITAKTSGGQMSLISTGIAPGDGIDITATYVRFDTKSFFGNVTQLSASATSTFFLQANEAGVFSTSVGLGGSIRLASDGALTATTNDGALEIVTRRTNGPLTMTSIGAGASFVVKSEQENSPITFKSAGNLVAKGNAVSITSLGSVVDGIVIQALRSNVNNPDDTSDIQIGASRNLQATASGRVDLIGEQGVSVSTTYIDKLGNGSPLVVSAGRNLVVDAKFDINVATVPQSHGAMELFAWDDIYLSSSSVNGQPSNIGQVRFISDSKLSFTAQTELTWFIDGALNTAVSGVLSITAHGRTNGFQRESVRIETQGSTSPLSFVSQRGSVLFTSFDTTSITAGTDTVNTQDITIQSLVGGTMSTLSNSIIWTSASTVALTAQRDEVRFSTLGTLKIQSTGPFTAQGSGKIDTGAWGVRVGSSSSVAGDVTFNSPTSIAVTAQEGIELRGTNVDISSGTAMQFTSSAVDAQTVIDSAGTLSFVGTTATFSANQDLVLQSTGSASVSAGGSLSITSAGSAVFYTPLTAAGADVQVRSNMNIIASTPVFSASATGEQGADLLMRNTFGRTRFAGTTSISLLARDSNIAIQAATYRQVVFGVSTSSAVTVNTDGPATLTGSNIATIQSPSTTLTNLAATFAISSIAGSVNTQSTGGVSITTGSLFLGASTSIGFTGTTGVTITAVGQDQGLIVRANVGNVGLTTAGSVLFRPTGTLPAHFATQFTSHSRFLIPFTGEPLVSGGPCTINRQLVYTTGSGLVGQLCVCTPYPANSDVAAATSSWDCLPIPRLNT